MREKYFNEKWAEYVMTEGTEAQRRYMPFVNMAPRVLKNAAKGRTAVCVTLVNAHASRISEFPRGHKSAIVNRSIVRGWLWPVLMEFSRTLHEENEELKRRVLELEKEVGALD